MAEKDIILKFRAELDQMRADLKAARGDIGRLEQSSKQAGKKMERNLNDSSKKIIRSFKKIAVAAGLAFGVREVINFTNEITTLANEASSVEAAFNRISKNAPNTLKELREATRGTVSDLDLMKNAVRASNFDIPLTELANLFEFARRRAAETGQSVEFLTNSIVLGIGRKSPLILDNLGISAVALREKLKGVSTEAADIGAITEVVGEIARGELEKMGDEAEGAANKQEQLNAAIKNLKVDLGESVKPLTDEFLTALKSVVQFAGAAADTINFLFEGIDTLEKEQIKNARQFAEIFVATAEERIAARLNEANTIAIVTSMQSQGIDITKDEVNATAIAAAAMERKIAKLEDQRDKYAGLAKAQGTSYLAEQDWNVELAKTNAQLDVYRKALRNLTREEQTQAEEVKPRTIEGLRKQIKELETLVEQIEVGTSAWFGYRAEIEQLQRTLTQWEAGVVDAQSQMGEFTLASKDMADGFIDVGNSEDEFIANMQKNLQRAKEVQDEASQNYFDWYDDARDFYWKMGATEEEYTREMARRSIERGRVLLQEGALTQEEFNQLVETANEAVARVEGSTIQGAQNVIGAFGSVVSAASELFAKVDEDGKKSAEFQKALGLFQIAVDTSVAIAGAIAAATRGSLGPVDLVAKIAATVGIVLTNLARAKSLINQTNMPTPPEYGEGGWIDGKPHSQGGTHIVAERGEFVVKKKQADKYRDAIEAINKGQFNDYLVRNYLEPMRNNLQGDQGSFAANINKLIEAVDDNSHYLQKMARRKGTNVENWDVLLRQLGNDKINRFKA